MSKIEFLAFAIVLVALIWIGSYVWEKRRSSAVRQVARELGLKFSEKDPLSIIPNHENFPLLNKGYGRKIVNRLYGAEARGEPAVFGYEYSIDSGGESQNSSQTVAWLSFKKDLPTFELRPENLWHKMIAAFGYADINFQDRPVFSKQYRLKGKDESGEVSSLFSSRITDYFEKHEYLCIESYKSGMLVYRKDIRLFEYELPGFYQQAKDIYSLFSPGGFRA